MKKICFLVIALIFSLCACQTEPLQLEKVEHIPAQIDQLIMYDQKLQLITSSADGTYIAVQTKAPLEAAFDIIDGTLQIHLNEAGKQHVTPQLSLYALTRGDATYEAIEVYINNTLVPFSTVTTF